MNKIKYFIIVLSVLFNGCTLSNSYYKSSLKPPLYEMLDKQEQSILLKQIKSFKSQKQLDMNILKNNNLLDNNKSKELFMLYDELISIYRKCYNLKLVNSFDAVNSANIIDSIEKLKKELNIIIET